MIFIIFFSSHFFSFSKYVVNRLLSLACATTFFIPQPLPMYQSPDAYFLWFLKKQISHFLIFHFCFWHHKHCIYLETCRSICSVLVSHSRFAEGVLVLVPIWLRNSLGVPSLYKFKIIISFEENTAKYKMIYPCHPLHTIQYIWMWILWAKEWLQINSLLTKSKLCFRQDENSPLFPLHFRTFFFIISDKKRDKS